MNGRHDNRTRPLLSICPKAVPKYESHTAGYLHLPFGLVILLSIRYRVTGSLMCTEAIFLRACYIVHSEPHDWTGEQNSEQRSYAT